MAVQGTKFETNAPDGDRVEVVVSKVITGLYEVNFGEVVFEIEAKDSTNAKVLGNVIYSEMSKIAAKYGGIVTTTDESVRAARR